MFLLPWMSYSESVKKYINITNMKQLHEIGAGVQDLFAHSFLPTLLPLVPKFNSISLQYTLNLNHPYYQQYVGGVDLNTNDSCNGFMNGYFSVFCEQIVYRIIGY